jgi:hypothetical protein
LAALPAMLCSFDLPPRVLILAGAVGGATAVAIVALVLGRNEILFGNRGPVGGAVGKFAWLAGGRRWLTMIAAAA